MKPEVRRRGVVAVFAEDVAGKVAAGFEFEMNSNSVDVSWVVVIVGKRRRVVSVGSEVERI